MTSLLPKNQGHKKKILLIEDNDGDAYLMKEYLRESQTIEFEMVRADRLKSALELLALNYFDAIFLDLSLPDGQGVELFEEVQRNTQTTPLIILTGTYQDQELAIQILQKGAEDYLTKGDLRAETVIRTVRYAIERKKAKEEIKCLNENLENRVKERTIELADANERLQGLNKMKDEFIATISHELRTPLTVVKMAFHNLKEIDGTLNPTQADDLEIGIKNVARLEIVINNLLDFSQLESGKLAIERKKLDGSQVISAVVEDFQAFADKQKKSISLELEKNLPPIFADPERLSQLLRNLLTNSVRFAKNKIFVRVWYRSPESSFIQVSIIDDGPGIDAQDQGRLFQKFEQINRPQGGGGYQGIGLGLAICKQIVEQQGGSIWVQSELGNGTQFHFTLPIYKN
jgi:signal transduction histidine kinase